MILVHSRLHCRHGSRASDSLENNLCAPHLSLSNFHNSHRNFPRKHPTPVAFWQTGRRSLCHLPSTPHFSCHRPVCLYMPPSTYSILPPLRPFQTPPFPLQSPYPGSPFASRALVVAQQHGRSVPICFSGTRLPSYPQASAGVYAKVHGNISISAS